MHVPATVLEERAKYAAIEWQYGPEWMKKNVTEGEALSPEYPDWVQFDEKGNTRGRQLQP